MDIDPYVAALRAELDAAAAAGTPEVLDAAGRLARVLDPATRLVLLDALGDAAAEVTLGLAAHAGGLGAVASVELRLRGRTPELSVEVVPTQATAPPGAPGAAGDGPPVDPADGAADADGGVSRLTVRVPDALKAQVETAAAASGSSVNAWVTRALADAVVARPGPRDDPQPRRPHGRGPGQRIQGWVR